MSDLRPFAERSADHLRSVIEAGRIGIWELDVATGRAIRNQRHDEIFGYPDLLPEWTYERFLGHVVEEDRERIDTLQKAAIENGTTWEFECAIRTADDRNRWIGAAGRPLRGPDGTVEKLIGHVIDVTSTKEREARLELLTAELNHRVRNMLAMIGSMVTMSAPRAKDIPSFVEALKGRVAALARSHHLLVSDEGAAMSASEILAAELNAFPGLRERTHVKADSKPALSTSTAQGLALVFHELITNALKYGAFSNEAGGVEISIAARDGDLCIEWVERGGPPVDPAGKPGFGSTLLTRVLGSGARVELDLAPAGLRCTVRVDNP
ncbi:sensor histidine kinase [Tsuneonella sp. SYSU-LHT278]|uniref:sensor histidine kinase n=1 Tax=Tsuneonella sediminis TaxID=3416089 RepID=UPI003F78BC89